MRILFLIALCLAVASANYAQNRQNFNRLLRQPQRQQQQQNQGYQGYGNQGLQLEDEYDSQEEDEDQEDNYNPQQQQQCRRQQRQQLNVDDQDEDQYEQDQDDEDQQDQYGQQGQRQGQRQGQHQGQQQQQRKRQQQQQHNCSPKYQHLQALEQANTQLAAKLYQQAKQENDDKNTAVSPAAVQLAAAAIKRGARGNTKRQLQRILGAGLNNQQTQEAHAALQNSLKGQDPMQQQSGQKQQAKVKTTTTIILNQKTHAQQRFVKAVKACQDAQVKKCDFQRQPQQCRQQINQYVAQKTNQKLQHTVPQDAVTTNTKAIVVNTAQIKAKWSRQVRQQQQTKQSKFYPLGSQQPKHVQVIQTQGQFNYYEDEQLKVVGLPTQQQELTLYVIVPKNKDGLNQVEKQQIQNGQQLKQLLEQAEQQQENVQVELPKIQIKHKIDAKQTLQKQGAQDAFDADEADLSGINGQQQQEQQRHRRQQQQDEEDDQDQQEQDEQQQNQQNQQQLHINKLIHQATIKINEQGISSANKHNRNQQQQQGQYQDQDQDQDQDDEYDEDDEQQQRYLQQQDTYDEIFGQSQNQRQRGQRGQQRRGRQQQQGQGQKKVKANRAFAFAIKHNKSNQIVMIGRVVDATQKPNSQQQQGRQQGQQSLNGVDQQ